MEATTHTCDGFEYKSLDKTYTAEKKTISIVMTTFNRPVQTMFTLKTISDSRCCGDIVEVIIVDDSDENQRLSDEQLSGFPFPIIYKVIDQKSKTWFNPCINYNIGLKQATGDIVVIQNSEVCHVGDMLSIFKNNINQTNYMVASVVGFRQEELNPILHGMYSSNPQAFVRNIKQWFDREGYYMKYANKKFQWYEHLGFSNRNLHFLTAITKENLVKLGGGFDPMFANVSGFDDDNLVHRIKWELGLNFCEIMDGPIGIHQWHPRNTNNPVYHHFIKSKWKIGAELCDKTFAEIKAKYDQNPVIHKINGNLIKLREYAVSEYGTREKFDFNRIYIRNLYSDFSFNGEEFVYTLNDGLTRKRRDIINDSGIYYQLYSQDYQDKKYELTFKCKSLCDQTTKKRLKVWDTEKWVRLDEPLGQQYTTYTVILTYRNPYKEGVTPDSPDNLIKINLGNNESNDSFAIKDPCLLPLL